MASAAADAATTLPATSVFSACHAVAWAKEGGLLFSLMLVANPINRYLIDSPMLPQLKKGADGGLTLLIQNESPGKDKEANWLPGPKGPFFMAMRLYLPKEEAMEGKWTQPPLKKAE
jgi:hypothetical protein